MAASPGLLPLCLPDPSCLTLEDMSRQGGVIIMTVSATSVGCACPRCGVHSSHIHSRYSRTLRDLPCHGAVVRICLRTHRFYCRAPDCPRRIFTQRLPVVVPPHGQTNLSTAQSLAGDRLRIGRGGGVSPGARSWELIAAQTQSCGSSTKLRLQNTPVMSKFSGWMIGPGAAAIATAQFWWI